MIKQMQALPIVWIELEDAVVPRIELDRYRYPPLYRDRDGEGAEKGTEWQRNRT